MRKLKCFQVLQHGVNKIFTRFLPCIINTFWPVIVILSIGIAVMGATLIFYWPRLELPKSSYVKMFTSGSAMLLENYETDLKYKFAFARKDNTREYKSMKIHFMWGIIPKDNGGTFDGNATEKATLIPDKSFNISSITAQQYLIDFCHTTVNQTFMDHSKPVICMLDYHQKILDTVCRIPSPYQAMMQPCCDIKQYPTEPWRFELCLPILYGLAPAIHQHLNWPAVTVIGQPLFDTNNKPSAYWMFLKTSLPLTPSHNQMEGEYKLLDAYHASQLSRAPPGLAHGWWGGYPDLLLYDLQTAIESGIFSSIALSLAATLGMMFLTSLNLLITLYAIITITLAIIATLGSLVLCNWVLNVVESLTLSLAVGLSIDFTIHYGVAYKLSEKCKQDARVQDAMSRVGKYTLSNIFPCYSIMNLQNIQNAF